MAAYYDARDVFDRALYVFFCPETLEWFVFKGGHTVNVYFEELPGKWVNTDVFCFGDFATDTETAEAAREAIRKHAYPQEATE